jgi:hypothetical protein
MGGAAATRRAAERRKVKEKQINKLKDMLFTQSLFLLSVNIL